MSIQSLHLGFLEPRWVNIQTCIGDENLWMYLGVDYLND